jgi:integrase
VFQTALATHHSCCPGLKLARQTKLLRKRRIQIERVRAYLLERIRLLDALMVCLIAYEGLRPDEARALEWVAMLLRTVRVEERLSDRERTELKGLAPSRSVDLLAAVREDVDSVYVAMAGRTRPNRSSRSRAAAYGAAANGTTGERGPSTPLYHESALAADASGIGMRRGRPNTAYM